MTDVREQIAWEKECARRGKEKYFAQQDALKDRGAADETEGANFLLRDRIDGVARRVKAAAYANRGTGGAYNALLRKATLDEDYHRVAFIGIKTALQALHNSRTHALTKICSTIGLRLEADLKCQMFDAKYPAFYATLERSLRDQGVTAYRHKHRTYMKKFKDFGVSWIDWSQNTRINLGSKVLKAVLEEFEDLLFVNTLRSGRKTTKILDSTVAFDEWLGEFEQARGMMHPDLLPLKVAPMDWDAEGNGGYYTAAMAHALPLIKTRGKAHRAHVEQFDPKMHREALNKLQKTPWEINSWVLEVQNQVFSKGLAIGVPNSKPVEQPPFPEHLAGVPKEHLTDQNRREIQAWKRDAKFAAYRERQRKSKIFSFAAVNRLARELEQWPRFYFAWNADFRGRLYCATAGLSPQGADSAKGLLRFSDGVIMGNPGLYWLAVHGANLFGEKGTYQDRADWVVRMEEHIRKVVEDPIENRAFWAAADKPWQFLAFCKEWSESDYGRNAGAVGHLPVALDGTCNGLQHFSALLRDSVGARATNLREPATPTDPPQDIYADVAALCTAHLRYYQGDLADRWKMAGVERKCAKRPVMTLPYGATQQSARQYIREYVEDNQEKFGETTKEYRWELAKFLTPVLWESIGETVVAARTGMAWLRRNIPNDFVKWVTPIGFPVYQWYKKTQGKVIRTKLMGRIQLFVHDPEQQAPPDKNRQRNGISPNFIHSLDSTHMVMTVCATHFRSYAMIHDDFGTHAGNTQELFTAIRETFHQLYTEHDPLKEWAEQVSATEELPEYGSYDIGEIKKAAYFFG